MRFYKTEGLIIKRVNFGEADRILTIFTKHYGKIKTIAKGVRKITSRRGGNLELFNFITISLSQGKNFDLISEVEVKQFFPKLRKNLKKIGIAYLLCELIDILCPERQKDEQILKILYQTLNSLEDEPKINKKIIRNFAIEILKELGYLVKDSDYSTVEMKPIIESIIQRKIKSDKFIKLFS